ncbi:MAG TPA: cytochrome c-type biogenesis protein CcmH [Pseudomonas sabulinigri]|uniref:CcmH/CycL/Ccl2/NrfF N-terminal domain-containing protein n=1 Tax=marine sediment metagenome TaxID=412755 RepID=A0A0F9VFX8_9ZZZZ|nr:cytochrome c-type biogenesis protein CcmH [Halopseudomonas sabulinigri]HEC51163.1 cytochrome c-type biogenesis protein CcmH [Halopseudomonas sabulinigri]|tara:strand:- start:4401 stop:4880 length:480 start_codon:yes stop_codon:yes gene_type:complete
MKRWLVGLTLGAVLLSAQAAVDTFEFKSEQERERFYSISTELRCPKCQNQNIADSDAPIAHDLRNEVFRLLEDGRSDDEIVDYMVARYGDFVRYRPALNAETLVLWFGPLFFLLAGFLAVFMLVRRRQRAAKDPLETILTSEEQQQLDQLLEEKKKRDD